MVERTRLDWRWNHVVAALSLTEGQAVRHLQECEGDDLVQRAYDFRRTLDQGLWWKPDAVSRAYGLYTGSPDYSPDTKLQTECYLLDPGMPMAEVANWLGLGLDTLYAYHDLFFEARPAFEKGAIGWLGCQLFRNGLYGHVSARDHIGKMHRIAWLLGSRVVLSFLTGGWHGNKPGEVQKAIAEHIRDYMLKLSSLNVMCMSNQGGELSIKMLEVMLDDVNKTVANKVAEQSGADHGVEILRFLREISVKVADPTDKRNLELPAREPRAADLISHVPTAELVPV